MDENFLGPNDLFRACVCLAISDPLKVAKKNGAQYKPFLTVFEDASRAFPSPSAWQLVLNVLHQRRDELRGYGRVQQDELRFRFRTEALRLIRLLAARKFRVGASEFSAWKTVTSWDPNEEKPAEMHVGKFPIDDLTRLVNEGGYRLRLRTGRVLAGKFRVTYPVLDVIGSVNGRAQAFSVYVHPAALHVGIGAANVGGAEFKTMLTKPGYVGPVFEWRDINDNVPCVGEIMASENGCTEVVGFFAVDHLLHGVGDAWDKGLRYRYVLKDFWTSICRSPVAWSR